MAHIPMDDTNTLWNETKQRSWSALHKTLEQHRGKTNGIEDALVEMMIKETEELESKGVDYPQSAEELNKVLNENLPQ